MIYVLRERERGQTMMQDRYDAADDDDDDRRLATSDGQLVVRFFDCAELFFTVHCWPKAGRCTPSIRLYREPIEAFNFHLIAAFKS